MAATLKTLTGIALGLACASTALAFTASEPAPGSAPNATPATPAAAAAPAADDAKLAKGRTIFADFACGTCHVLKDAGGDGHVGPSLDGNANLTVDFVTGRVANGQGAMPGFAGQLSDEEIADVSTYIVQVAAK